MSVVLVTGAAGFTGRYLVPLLTAQGHEVHGVVHHRPSVPVADLSNLHEADLTDPAAAEQVVAAVAPDHVIHLAAIAFVAHGQVDEMYRTNIVGTRHLLDALSRSAGPLISVVLASSANVYGNARDGLLAEDLPPYPANDYGVSKTEMEYLAGIYRDQLPLIIARPFNYTGRGQAENYLIPKIIAHARSRAQVIELGNLDVRRDFSDVRTVVDCYTRLMLAPAAVGGTFNICSGVPVSLTDILSMVANISGHRMEVRVNPAFVRQNEVHTLAGSRAKLTQVVGAPDPIPLEQTLRWMLDG